MAVKQRHMQADYLNVAPGAEDEFVLMGAGFKTLDESPAAQTSSTRYINDKSASKSINGYDWTTAFDIDQIKDEKAVEFICKIGKEQLTGEDAETAIMPANLKLRWKLPALRPLTISRPAPAICWGLAAL